LSSLAHELWHAYSRAVDFWQKTEGIRDIINHLDYLDTVESAAIDRAILLRWGGGVRNNTIGAYDEQFADALATLVVGNAYLWDEATKALIGEDALTDITHDFMRNTIYDKVADAPEYTYDESLPNEATNRGGHIFVGPKFMELDAGQKRFVLFHEQGHDWESTMGWPEKIQLVESLGGTASVYPDGTKDFMSGRISTPWGEYQGVDEALADLYALRRTAPDEMRSKGVDLSRVGTKKHAKTAVFADYDYHYDVWSDVYGEDSVRDALLKQIGADDDCALVVGLGDYNKLPTEENIQEVREMFDEHFGVGGWLSVPGNHEVEYVDDKPDNLEWYHRAIGWGVVDSADRGVAYKNLNGDNFVLLDTSFKELTDEVAESLEECLLGVHANGGRTFVFTHMPCIDSVPESENEEDHGMEKAQSARFIELMERFGVTAVFSSHSHGYETWTRNGVSYVGIALGGSKKDEQQEQWAFVRVFVGDIVRVERVPLFPEVPESAYLVSERGRRMTRKDSAVIIVPENPWSNHEFFGEWKHLSNYELGKRFGGCESVWRKWRKRFEFPQSSPGVYLESSEMSLDELVSSDISEKDKQEELKEVRRRYNKLLQQESLYRRLSDIGSDVLNQLSPVCPPPKPLAVPGKTIHQGMVLNFADWHLDEIVNEGIMEGLNFYDPPTALRRVECTVDKTIMLSRLSERVVFGTLYVHCFGDFLTNVLRAGFEHTDSMVTASMMPMKGAKFAATILAHALRDLAANFPVVRVRGVPGNHGRFTKGFAHKLPTENLDWLVYQWAMTMCRDLKNVEWDIPEAWSHTCDVEGWGFFLNHGHSDAKGGFGGIGWYQLLKSDTKRTALDVNLGRKVLVRQYGHLHQEADVGRAGGNGRIRIEPSLIGGNEFPKEGMAGTYDEPAQSLLEVHPKEGLVAERTLSIRQHDRNPSCRYDDLLEIL
jgi:hypothetical protein